MNSPTVSNAAGFDVFNLDPALLNALRKAGYDEPRPIQTEAIPSVIAGRDVLGLAQTGTGKTAAFGLPLLQRLLENPGPGPRALILAPTRELAIQIDKEIRTLARGTRIRTVTVYGGVSAHAQIQTLRKRPEIVVGCPGRVLDLFQRGEVKVGKIDTLILDEADHMFDMGFLPDIRRIISNLPKKRQNLLFAATMPKDLRKLTNQILVDPMVAELAHSKPAETIEHALYPVQQTRKLALLEHLLKDASFFSSIVFTRTKHRANRLACQLKNRGLRAIAIQGNMTQGARDRAMKGFRDCRFDVLVATDIVARGIDVDQVSHVINYDVPDNAESYTHRIGRTGRSEREGQAYTFVAENDLATIEDIERRLGVSIDRRTIEGFEGLQIPLPTRRQRSGSQRSSGRRSSHGQRGSRPTHGGSRNRRSGDSRFKSSGSGKPRHNSNRSDDSRFKSSGSGKPRHDSRRSDDSGTPTRKSGKSRARNRRANDLPFEFKWAGDAPAAQGSGEGEAQRQGGARRRSEAEDTRTGAPKRKGKRRRQRNRHRNQQNNADA